VTEHKQLGLGTVQLGGDYGAIDHNVVPDLSDARALISLAIDSDVAFLDTAAGYGNAESVLGACLPAACPIPVVTKLPPLPEGCADIPGFVSQSVSESTANLGGTSPTTVMIHRPEDAIGPRGAEIAAALAVLKSERVVTEIGVSLYDASEIEAFPGLPDMDCIQLPVSILDQRLVASGVLRDLRAGGTQVIARSAYLQGVLLAPADEIPAPLRDLERCVAEVQVQAAALSLRPIDLCLGYLKACADVDAVVIGVKTADQLRETLEVWERPAPACDWEAFSAGESGLLDPRSWGALA